MSEPLSAREQLIREVQGLAVEEILALCYSFGHSAERLSLYLDVLRKRGGQRAQFASCLICFDLARQGDTSAGREFSILADTVRTLAQQSDMVQGLLGEDPYLSFVWELLENYLEELDPRFAADSISIDVTEEVEEVASFDLLSDEDFDDEIMELDFRVDEPQMLAEFNEAVSRFLGSIPGVPMYDPEAGFRLRNRHDTDRTERFLKELSSLREFVPLARGFRALTMLFYGSHQRSKGLFGNVNKRKQSLLREGLAEFVSSGPEMIQAAGAISALHADPSAWGKIAEAILDFLAWSHRENPESLGDPEDFDAVAHCVSRDSQRKPDRAARRRGQR